MFTAVYMLNEDKEFPTLKEAVGWIVKKLKVEPAIPLIMLDQGIWVKEKDWRHPIFFYDLRDHACDRGWLKNGEWVGD